MHDLSSIGPSGLQTGVPALKTTLCLKSSRELRYPVSLNFGSENTFLTQNPSKSTVFANFLFYLPQAEILRKVFLSSLKRFLSSNWFISCFLIFYSLKFHPENAHQQDRFCCFQRSRATKSVFFAKILLSTAPGARKSRIVVKSIVQCRDGDITHKN